MVSRTVQRSRSVVCESCGEFEMGKSYRGGSATDGERHYVESELPEECPVCGSETTEKRGDA